MRLQCDTSVPGESPFVGRLAALYREIGVELAACGRTHDRVTVVGVTKKQPVQAIEDAAGAGLSDIAENYVQEARTKFAEMGAVEVCKHFVGHLQTNKAKMAVQLFDVVQTIDRLEAATALARAAQNAGTPRSVLLQVNISSAERFGCPPQQAERLAEGIRELSALRLDGVMAIGPVTQDRSEIMRAFELAAKTFGCVGGSVLSIGMSNDWREALRAGSTMIRIGTALFGERRV